MQKYERKLSNTFLRGTFQTLRKYFVLVHFLDLLYVFLRRWFDNFHYRFTFPIENVVFSRRSVRDNEAVQQSPVNIFHSKLNNNTPVAVR